MISIIIPLYNKEKYIKRTLLSVLSQKFHKFELIIVDDGSTDKSLSIVSAINDYRINIIKKNNSGVSAARNMGIKMAKYSYIAFLDADDYWDENYLEKISILINTYGEDVIYTTGYSINYGNRRFIRNIVPDNSPVATLDPVRYFTIMFNKNWGIHTSSVVVPKAILDKIGGFPVGISHGEDSYLWDRVAAIYRVIHLPDVLSHYDGNVEGQLTKKSQLFGLPPTALGLHDLKLRYSLELEALVRKYLLKITGRKFIQDILVGWKMELQPQDVEVLDWINPKISRTKNTKMKIFVLSIEYIIIFLSIKFNIFKNNKIEPFEFNLKK